MIFVTFWQARERKTVGESYAGVNYIVDSTGYESIPQIISRLMRGERVDPKSGMYFDGDADELEDCPDVPEVEDITDVESVVDKLHEMREKQVEFEASQARELKLNGTEGAENKTETVS